jgi:hypothetical protein
LRLIVASYAAIEVAEHDFLLVVVVTFSLFPVLLELTLLLSGFLIGFPDCFLDF